MSYVPGPRAIVTCCLLLFLLGQVACSRNSNQVLLAKAWDGPIADGCPYLHFVATKEDACAYPYESIPKTFKNTYAHERSLLAATGCPACAY